jgi:GDP-D-mannose dehydratase
LQKNFWVIKGVLYLGNVNAKRDWGHAKDYVEMQWKILQQKKPEDFVIATGKAYTVKQFVNMCCDYLGLKIVWKGKGLNTKAYLISGKKKELIIKIDKKYFRPLDIDYLKGDPKKAFKKLNFKFKHSVKDLIKDMLDSDINELQAKKNQYE